MVGLLNKDLPWRMKVWLVSSKISQPSTIILSMARFFLMFSVSLTSSCMTLSNTIRDHGKRFSIAPADKQRSSIWEARVWTCISLTGAVG